MRYKLAVILGAALLLTAGLAALEQPKAKGDCCAPKGDAKAAASEPLRCTLTGKTVESCCCTEKDGKLYCPLAKKTIESCCCVPANAAQAKGEASEDEPLRCGREEKSAANCPSTLAQGGERQSNHCAHGKQEKKKE